MGRAPDVEVVDDEAAGRHPDGHSRGGDGVHGSCHVSMAHTSCPALREEAGSTPSPSLPVPTIAISCHPLRTQSTRTCLAHVPGVDPLITRPPEGPPGTARAIAGFPTMRDRF